MAKQQVELKLRTGRRPAKEDERNLKLADVMDTAIAIPSEYDVDKRFPEIGASPIPMFLNNRWGCCVISGRAHQTLRFEYVEQGKLINITDNEVEKQYFHESGGQDDGLFVLDSLKSWRTEGWRAGGRKYNIDVFAQIDNEDHVQLKTAIFAKLGIGLGIRLPRNYIDVFNSGREWDGSLVGSNRLRHYVLATGYSSDGLTFLTWGARRFMTWDYVDSNCDEGYAIVDDINRFDNPRSPFDADAARDFLENRDN
ncbi:MAG: hypothetical protein L0Y71_02775 [Gemmataceae bacterium]|nr:hypothetical protein [Gemmataceae bacterium]